MKTATAWWVLWAAVFLGVVVDLLLNGQVPGISVPIALALGLAAVELIARRTGVVLRPQARVLMWLALLFGLGAALRSSVTLLCLDYGCILIIGVLVALRGRSGALSCAAVTEYLTGAFPVGLQTLVGVVPLIGKDIDWKTVFERKNNGRILIVVRGLLIGLPLLVLFGALFASADAEFSALLAHLFNWDLASLWSHFWGMFFYFVLAAGVLRLFLLWERTRPAPVCPPWKAVGFGEVAIVLAMLNVLFFAFVLVQFRFLFGSHAFIQSSIHMNYAQYARSGFFELVWVTLLVLPILLLLHWILREPTKRQSLLFRILTCVLVAQLYVIMLSAVHRMQLYVLATGLTELRLYSSAFMAWLAVVFVWFLATVLAEHRERFAFGALAAAFVFVIGLNILNPDDAIVRYDSARAGATGGVGMVYAQSLSSDAVPALVGWINHSVDQQTKAAGAGYLLRTYSTDKDQDWRSWNWSRTAARAAVRRNKASLAQITSRDARGPHRIG